MCQVSRYSQNLSPSAGPVGQCASSWPMLLVSRPKRDWPPKADTGMLEGMVQLQEHQGRTHSVWCVRLHRCLRVKPRVVQVTPPPGYDSQKLLNHFLPTFQVRSAPRVGCVLNKIVRNLLRRGAAFDRNVRGVGFWQAAQRHQPFSAAAAAAAVA